MKSLQAKLSALLVAMLLVVSGVYLFFATRSTELYLAETIQTTNQTLAASITKELHIDEQTNNFMPEEIVRLFESAMMINPNIKLYLVHPNGNVWTFTKADGYLQKGTVSIEKIMAFLSNTEPMPIFGDDPLDAENPKVFSVAPLYRNDGSLHCYLYIILSSEKTSSLVMMMQKSYIVQVLLKTLAISLVAALTLGLFLIWLLTRDLQRFTTFIGAVKSGDYSARIHIQRRDELQQLATAFNDMVAAVESSIRQLKHTDELRRELIANVSHDLRTPLASIEGYLETILNKAHLLSDEERKRYLSVIHNNTRSLNRLIAQLFELSKLEANQITATLEPFSLSELAQDVLMQVMPKAVEKNIQLTQHFAPEMFFVNGDIALIQRVLQNLLENALNYTDMGGAVEMRIGRKHQTAYISVSDTGSGISTTDLPHIFDRYYQSDSVRPKQSSGAGLGLAIAKRILELHHTALDVMSDVGKGTTFSFALRVHSDIGQAALS
jgi:two-component system, OmpR family, sensor kinase